MIKYSELLLEQEEVTIHLRQQQTALETVDVKDTIKVDRSE
jgi:hypothetical protein